MRIREKCSNGKENATHLSLLWDIFLFSVLSSFPLLPPFFSVASSSTLQNHYKIYKNNYMFFIQQNCISIEGSSQKVHKIVWEHFFNNIVEQGKNGAILIVFILTGLSFCNSEEKKYNIPRMTRRNVLYVKYFSFQISNACKKGIFSTLLHI
jgi:hypothetical protein